MVVDTEMQSQEELQGKHLSKQLAACVRSIQWSYAIFWSLSIRQEGLLEWNDGYYNGDIKTRKTTQPTECKADQMGLQRSEQLRELYESLSAGESNQQNKRPSASLSPEDLTDAEWYYLVCMSFTFMLGQDLPGKVYKHNEPIWLNNAQLADNKSFGRSLLAKSASIQTVVCLPFMDGVLELGTSDLVLDEPGFVQNIKSSFWELQVPVCSEHSTSSPPFVRKDQEVEDPMMLENHALMIENDCHAFPFPINSYDPNRETVLIHDNVTEHHPGFYDEIIGTPEDISNVCDDPFRIKRLKESSQVHREHLIDDEFSNSLHGSFNSRECLSWSFAQNILSSPKGERVRSNMLDHLQEDNQAKPSSLGVDSGGSHYDSTLSAVLGNLKQQMSPAVFSVQNASNASSFKVWRSGSKNTKKFTKIPQRLLKKILIDSNWMNGDQLVKPQEEHVSRNKAWKSETDDTNANHVLSERRRREKLNEKFLILRSLVPSISKVDKASILADTIEYLKELERRVEELESCREEADPDMTERRKHPDIAERTCDNYGNNGLINCQKSSTNKRKAGELDEAEAEHHQLTSRNGAMDINITIIEKEVLVEMQCPWRDLLLLDMLEAMSNLRLDAHSVQSSTVDGTLAITLRAKLIGTVVASPGMIKRALQRVVSKY